MIFENNKDKCIYIIFTAIQAILVGVIIAGILI